METREEWKSVKGYEGYYEVSNYGNVRSVHRVLTYNNGALREWTSIPIKQHIRKRYLSVLFNKKATAKHYCVHRLVATAFIGDCPEGLQVNHKDGIKNNNFQWNLEYVTAKENIQHSYRYGLNNKVYGENVSNSVLSNKQAEEIRIKYKTGKYFYKDLAKNYGVSDTLIGNLIRNKTYSRLEK